MAPRSLPAAVLLTSLVTLFCSTPAPGAQRVVLVEEITSGTCPPCFSENPPINAMLDSYGAQVAAIKWHVWWPTATILDHLYYHNSPVIDWRIGDAGSVPPYGFYQGAAAPSLYIDGGGERLFDEPSNTAEIDGRLASPSPLAISGTAVLTPGTSPTSVEVSLDVTVETPVAGVSNRIFAALTEERVATLATVTGTIASGSKVITNMSSTAGISRGMRIWGAAGVPSPNQVSSIDSPTQVTLLQNATQSGVRTLTFKSYNQETEHHDVFRVVNNNNNPSATGTQITMTSLGTQHFDFSLPIAAAYDPAELHVVVWVQNMAGVGAGEVYQAKEMVPTQAVSVGGPGPSLAMLGQNRPNPFQKGGTSIPFAIQKAGEVDLAVYDVSGRFMSQLVRGSLAAGAHLAHWDGRDASGRAAAGGVYYYRLKAAGLEFTRRMVMMR